MSQRPAPLHRTVLEASDGFVRVQTLRTAWA